MADLDASIRKLADRAAILNSKTDELNEVFIQVEKRLAEARVGVSVWLDDEDSLFEELSQKAGHSTAWALGYAKLGEEWRLAAKLVEREEYDDPDIKEMVVRSRDASNPVAVVKAPRSVRVAATTMLEPLIEALTKRVNAFVGNIERAKRLVESK